MFSYVFMKILEGRPEGYDRWMDRLSGGRIGAIKREVADEFRSGERVLEVGCGTGALAAMLVERGCRVEGLDASRGMVQEARERIEREGLDEHLSVRRSGVEGMGDLPDGEFDGVVAMLVLSELSDDERRFTLRQAARVLRPGGRIVVADEVTPRTAGQWLLHGVVRAPALAATYLVTGTATLPVADLAGDLADAEFTLESEARSHGDAFAIVIARKGAP